MTKTVIATPEFIDKLKKEHNQLEKYNVKDIIKQYHKFLLKKICEERDGIYLPVVGAHMFIGVFKAVPKYCEKRLAKENGEKEYRKKKLKEKLGWKEEMEVAFNHYNVHDRDGYEARIMYSIYRLRYMNKNAKYWGFLPNVTARAACTKAFRENWKNFIFIPNIRYIQAVFKRENRKVQVKKNIQQIEQKTEYNEFRFDDDIEVTNTEY